MKKEKISKKLKRLTYSEQEAATVIGIDRTSVRRIALERPSHAIAKACLHITDHKRVYSREVIDAYVSGFKELGNYYG